MGIYSKEKENAITSLSWHFRPCSGIVQAVASISVPDQPWHRHQVLRNRTGGWTPAPPHCTSSGASGKGQIGCSSWRLILSGAACPAMSDWDWKSNERDTSLWMFEYILIRQLINNNFLYFDITIIWHFQTWTSFIWYNIKIYYYLIFNIKLIRVSNCYSLKSKSKWV